MGQKWKFRPNFTFIDDAMDKPKRALVQVKSGHVKVGDLRDLRGTIERENAALGVFVTLHAPSEAMKKEAVAAGFYHSPGWNQDYPRLQILTVSDLLAGSACKCRRQASPSSKRKRSSPSRRRSKAN